MFLSVLANVFRMNWFLSLLRKLPLKFGLGWTSPAPVAKGQEVWLFDNTAFPAPGQPGKWSAEFVAAYFEEDSGSKAAKAVAEIADQLGFAGDEEAEGRIAERHVLPGEGYVDDQIVESSAVLVEGEATMRTAFAEEVGWGVISDIDDTIKVSEVRNRISLLKRTFVDIPAPVPGMKKLYQTLQSRLNKPAWFYLSASPYNLYPLLRCFTSDHFPRGQLILREMSWMELESFIVTLTIGTQRYKEERMRRVFAWLPRRKWVLIGDSTQTDPEAYATLYREFPERVGRIWIRVVRGVDEAEETELNSQGRFKRAFEGVPAHVWRTFEQPGELEESVQELQ
ncbi:hypothetical protein C7212DRAFT_356666 [Tuber magnatum]|uniref:Phosphatidate phosphatase APP1 catalytic domain-containing protein n=1 Tax=Tuber magnatum TaxID=42249 RepID=A0A317SSK0_9PEZI|nr:hypothetical protein C7212DRAFT_356666 [Tuber magnatum]